MCLDHLNCCNFLLWLLRSWFDFLCWLILRFFRWFFLCSGFLSFGFFNYRCIFISWLRLLLRRFCFFSRLNFFCRFHFFNRILFFRFSFLFSWLLFFSWFDLLLYWLLILCWLSFLLCRQYFFSWFYFFISWLFLFYWFHFFSRLFLFSRLSLFCRFILFCWFLFNSWLFPLSRYSLFLWFDFFYYRLFFCWFDFFFSGFCFIFNWFLFFSSKFSFNWSLPLFFDRSLLLFFCWSFFLGRLLWFWRRNFLCLFWSFLGRFPLCWLDWFFLLLRLQIYRGYIDRLIIIIQTFAAIDYLIRSWIILTHLMSSRTHEMNG